MKTEQKETKPRGRFICTKCCKSVLISANEADEIEELSQRVTDLEQELAELKSGENEHRDFLGFDIYGNPN